MIAHASTYSPISVPRPAGAAFRPHGTLTVHLPWLAAVLVAPFCFGAVSGESQAALAFVISVSLFLTATRVRWVPESSPGKVALAVLAITLILPLVLLPSPSITALSPEAARLGLKTLSLNWGEGIIRLWQFGFLAAVFVMAREAASVHRFTGALSYGVALALLGLAGTEFWLLFDGKGVWRQVQHYPAGTFANRNHFANWMVMGAMLIFGALLRKIRHLRAKDFEWKNVAAVILLGSALLASVASVMACGSRGGMLAMAVGGGVWIAILLRQRACSAVLGAMGIAAIGAVAAFAIWGDLFMQRITQDALGFKVRIWLDALAMGAKFPLFGVGLGGFETGFTIYKSFHGEGTFLFAENDYLQWLVETGVLGTLCALVLVFLLVAKLAKSTHGKHLSKSEFFYGAVAALAAFAVHASIEFVAHVMATALFAAVLLGVAVGLKARASGPTVAPEPGKFNFIYSIAVAAFIALLAAPQTMAASKWRNSDDLMAEAVDLWPLETERAIILARRVIRTDSMRAHESALQILDRSLSWHPLDWRLRLEKAWLLIAANPNIGLPEALRVMALNPLQAQIPLRFAASLAQLHPPSAMEILKQGRYEKAEQVKDALQIAWNIEPTPANLWEIASATEAGRRALEDFARTKGLEALARQAASLPFTPRERE